MYVIKELNSWQRNNVQINFFRTTGEFSDMNI